MAPIAAPPAASESTAQVGAPIPPAGEPAGTCTLFPQAVEGPFYFDPDLVRADITQNRPGLPLRLKLRVIAAGPCKPIANARVDVWHADATGFYSGYAGQGTNRDISTKGETYLRGTQITDADGFVTFQTIYPGWYPGRTPHIHVKVFLDDNTLVTGQMYFPDDVSAKVYATNAPYADRPKADTTNANDFIFKTGQREGGGIVLAMSQEDAGMVAGLVIAVDTSGKAARAAHGGIGGFSRRWLGR